MMVETAMMETAVMEAPAPGVKTAGLHGPVREVACVGPAPVGAPAMPPTGAARRMARLSGHHGDQDHRDYTDRKPTERALSHTASPRLLRSLEEPGSGNPIRTLPVSRMRRHFIHFMPSSITTSIAANSFQ